ncbi:MAG: response regulator transcription factor [Candidatus Dormibacteraeota bacterium]|nr:response regulator transcription factor [Candidatus Dormibacteraeota bacterium]
MSASWILVVEDDNRLAATLERVLTAEGHQVELAGDGMEALRRARERSPDLAILDVMLPGLDGIAVCRRLRATAQFPILMLTALAGTEERVRGLDSGADDYLVKPFAYQELLARVRALLRRSRPTDHLQFGDLALEPSCREVWRGSRPIVLTAAEFALLEHFLRHPRQVLTREQLLKG